MPWVSHKRNKIRRKASLFMLQSYLVETEKCWGNGKTLKGSNLEQSNSRPPKNGSAENK